MIKPGVFISDRYEIIDKVGSGGMADVYKAKCHKLNRFVAVKVLKSEYNNDDTFVAKFRAEAQAAAGLSHPNIVNVFDVGDDDNLHYIVMELVEGITLKSFIEKKGQLGVKESIGIAVQIAQGLEIAHRNHIIHRDIKPQNIMISKEGKVKVTDFGIAKAVTSDTVTSNAMGSVHYISPEQARGGYSDERSDVYSLGVTIYEMLTGKVPFNGDNTVSVALLQIQGEAIPLRDLEPELPISLSRIVQKCMQKKPERRYQSASALIVDLKQALIEPDGDYVMLGSETSVDESPTIALTPDQVDQINQVASDRDGRQERKIFKPEIARDEPFDFSQVEKKKAEEAEEEDDKDNDSEVDPKLEKAMIIGSIVAAVILVIVIVFIFGKIFGLFGKGKPSDLFPSPSPSPTALVTVPPEVDLPQPTITATPSKALEIETVNVQNVRGMEKEKAVELLQKDGFQVSIDETESKEVSKNRVIDQSVKPDTQAEKGSEIILTVSIGVSLVPVPDVYNNSADTAERILKGEGFKISWSEIYHDTVETGMVVRTEPEKGSSIEPGSTVKIVLSKGKEKKEILVPNLENKTENDAVNALQNAGLKKGTVTREYHDTVAEGMVIRADTSPGVSVEEGTKIGFTISLGKEVTEPTSYVANLVIDANPFTEDVPEGNVVLILSQNGKEITIFDDYISESDLPLDISAESDSPANGSVKMYLDGAEVPGKWIATFTEVQ